MSKILVHKYWTIPDHFVYQYYELLDNTKGPFRLHGNCIALPHCSVLHRNCDVAALWCHLEVEFILTWNAVKLQWLAAESNRYTDIAIWTDLNTFYRMLISHFWEMLVYQKCSSIHQYWDGPVSGIWSIPFLSISGEAFVGVPWCSFKGVMKYDTLSVEDRASKFKKKIGGTLKKMFNCNARSVQSVLWQVLCAIKVLGVVLATCII